MTTIPFPYLLVKDYKQSKKFILNYEKNPCPNKLSDFLICFGNNKQLTNKECKQLFKEYIRCIKKFGED